MTLIVSYDKVNNDTIYVKVTHRFTRRLYTATFYIKTDIIDMTINLYTATLLCNEAIFNETCQSCKILLYNAKKDYNETNVFTLEN